MYYSKTATVKNNLFNNFFSTGRRRSGSLAVPSGSAQRMPAAVLPRSRRGVAWKRRLASRRSCSPATSRCGKIQGETTSERGVCTRSSLHLTPSRQVGRKAALDQACSSTSRRTQAMTPAEGSCTPQERIPMRISRPQPRRRMRIELKALSSSCPHYSKSALKRAAC